MKKIFGLLIALSICITTQAQFDTWSIFSKSRTYFGGEVKATNNFKGDRGTLYGAYRLPKGETLVLTGDKLPLLMEFKKDGFSSKYDADFGAIGYTASQSNGMVKDAKGNIYIFSGPVLYKFDSVSEKWSGFNFKTSANTTSMPMPEANLWVIRGIAFSEKGELTIIGEKAIRSAIVLQLQGESWVELANFDYKVMNTLKGHTSGFVSGSALTSDGPYMTKLGITQDGTLWTIGMNDESASLVKIVNGEMLTVDDCKVTDLTQYTDGSVLIATTEGLFETNSATSDFNKISEIPTSAVTYNKQTNTIWFTSPESKTYWNRYSVEDKTLKSYLSDEVPIGSTVYCINEDNDRNQAVMTRDGLYLLDRSNVMKDFPKWKKYSEGDYNSDIVFKEGFGTINRNGLAPTRFATLNTQDSRKDYVHYFGIFENGVWNTYNIKMMKEAKGFFSSGNVLSASCSTSKGIFLGTSNNGLFLYNRERNEAIPVQSYDVKAFSKEILDIVEDKNGTIWIATKKGLLKYDGDHTFELLDKKNSGLEARKINALYVSPSNKLWLGTSDKGLVSYDGQNWSYIDKKSGLKQQNIKVMYGSGEKIYAASVNFVGRADIIQIVDGSDVVVEKMPIIAGDGGFDVDENGNLWIANISDGTIVMRPAEGGDYVVYKGEESPIQDKIKNNSIYVHNGIVYMMVDYESKDELSDTSGGGAVPKFNSSVVRTFINNTVFQFNVK